jgi:hypothetical protein
MKRNQSNGLVTTFNSLSKDTRRLFYVGIVAERAIFCFKAFTDFVGLVFIQWNYDRLFTATQGMVGSVAIGPMPRLHAGANQNFFFTG